MISNKIIVNYVLITCEQTTTNDWRSENESAYVNIIIDKYLYAKALWQPTGKYCSFFSFATFNKTILDAKPHRDYRGTFKIVSITISRVFALRLGLGWKCQQFYILNSLHSGTK